MKKLLIIVFAIVLFAGVAFGASPKREQRTDIESPRYPLDIAIPESSIFGFSNVHVNGYNDDVDSAAAEDIITSGNTYTFITTTATLFLSSSVTTDTGQTINITYLDANWNQLTTNVLTNGRTPVELPTASRVNLADYNDTISLVGDVVIYSTSTLSNGVPDDTTAIKSKIIASDNVSQNAIYSVPLGKTAYLKNWHVSSDDDYTVIIWAREFGTVWQVKDRIKTTEAAPRPAAFGYDNYISFAAKSDIRFEVTVADDNTVVACHFELVIIDD